MTDPVACLDGQFLPLGEARISPLDRGFLFAHAAYEVTAVYNGRLIDFAGHEARLRRTLDALEIPFPDLPASLEALHEALMARNALEEGLVYLQISAGAYAARDFAGPDTLTPSLFMTSTDRRLIGDAARDGIHAISHADSRWKRRDLKTTQLLTQALAYRAARDRGGETALLHEGGLVTEAASANAWLVTRDAKLVTRDLSPAILAGITRAAVMELGLEVDARAFSLDEVRSGAELFTTSAGALVVPVTHLDGEPVGNGQPGPVTRKVQAAYYERIGADVACVAPWATG